MRRDALFQRRELAADLVNHQVNGRAEVATSLMGVQIRQAMANQMQVHFHNVQGIGSLLQISVELEFRPRDQVEPAYDGDQLPKGVPDVFRRDIVISVVNGYFHVVIPWFRAAVDFGLKHPSLCGEFLPRPLPIGSRNHLGE